MVWSSAETGPNILHIKIPKVSFVAKKYRIDFISDVWRDRNESIDRLKLWISSEIGSLRHFTRSFRWIFIGKLFAKIRNAYADKWPYYENRRYFCHSDTTNRNRSSLSNRNETINYVRWLFRRINHQAHPLCQRYFFVLLEITSGFQNMNSVLSDEILLRN